MGWIGAGVVIALGAIGLAVLREGYVGVVEIAADAREVLAVVVLVGLSLGFGWRLAVKQHQPLRAAAGGTVAGAIVCAAMATTPWLGVGPIVAAGVFGLLVTLLVATTPRVRVRGVGLGLVGGLVDGEGAACAEVESERARAA